MADETDYTRDHTRREFLVAAAGVAAIVTGVAAVAGATGVAALIRSKQDRHMAELEALVRSSAPIEAPKKSQTVVSPYNYEGSLSYHGAGLYSKQRSDWVFKQLVSTVDYNIEQGAGELQLYRGTIDSILKEEQGGIASALLSVERRQDKLQLLLGKGSYEVTDGVYAPGKTLTGLFDPGNESVRGEPLLRKNCQPGDKVTVICWTKDNPCKDPLLRVRAFGNYTQGYFMSSPELIRAAGLGRNPNY